MKLSQDAKLTKALVKKFDGPIQNITEAIDAYLEEHGFHIYPVKKEKGTPWHADYKRVFENEEYWEVFKGYLKEELGKGNRCFSLNVREDGTFSIYPELEKEKGTVSFKEVEEELPWNDQSITTMESLLEKALFLAQRPKYGVHPYQILRLYECKTLEEGRKILTEAYKKHKDESRKLTDAALKALKEMYEQPLQLVPCEPTYVPWMKCPVCEGAGKWRNPIDSPTRFGIPLSDCECCQKAGVIPMCKQTK